ncbi:MAG: SIMPL domain-containing protein [Bacteriovorax sp.]
MKNIIFLFLLLTQSAFADRIRLITVTGSAEKFFAPDMAKIQLSVWGKSENAKSAQGLSNDQYEQVKKALDAFQVMSADVQTIGYELSPDYTYDNKTHINKVIGYTATQSIRVTLKKVSNVGKFLDEIIMDSKNLKAGTSVYSVTWDLEKRDEIEKNLLAEAVKSAEAQAELLARAAKVKVKGVYHLSPQGVIPPVPMYQAEAMMLKSAAGGNRSTDVFSGEVKVKADVAADYEIE